MFFTHYALIRRFDLSLYNINLNVLVYTHIPNQHLFWYIYILLYICWYVQIKGDINASVRIRVLIYLGKFLHDVYNYPVQLVFPPLRQRLSHYILEIRILDKHPFVERQFWCEEHTGSICSWTLRVPQTFDIKTFKFIFCSGVYWNINATRAKLNFKIYLYMWYLSLLSSQTDWYLVWISVLVEDAGSRTGVSTDAFPWGTAGRGNPYSSL